MTTKITVDAHAGWPVAVTKIERYLGGVKARDCPNVPANTVADFHVHSNADIIVREVQPAGVTPMPLDFADVVRGLKAGKRYARAGWNGKGMFIFLVPGSRFTVNREPLLSILGEGADVSYCEHIDIKRVDGSIATWAPSNGDTLAEDWAEV